MSGSATARAPVPRRQQLPWNNGQEIDLLKLIIHHQAHTADKKVVIEAWNKVNDDLFNQESMVTYKSEHYVKGDVRKIRAKYGLLTENCCKRSGWGEFYGGSNQNLSGLSGDLSMVFSLVKQCLKDVESKTEMDKIATEEAEEKKRKLELISKDAFDHKKNKPLRMKSLDGTIFDRTDRPVRKTFEEQVLGYLYYEFVLLRFNYFIVLLFLIF